MGLVGLVGLELGPVRPVGPVGARFELEIVETVGAFASRRFRLGLLGLLGLETFRGTGEMRRLRRLDSGEDGPNMTPSHCPTETTLDPRSQKMTRMTMVANATRNPRKTFSCILVSQMLARTSKCAEW